MIISIIVAKSENNVIGKNNDLVWHLPADQKYFRETTMGHYVVMGRKTFESLNKPLPGRTNIVITRNPEFRAEGCVIVHNLDEAIEFCKKNRQQEIFILGGGEIYRQALPFTQKIYITEVKGVFDGDTFFPPLNPDDWKEVSREFHNTDEKHAYEFDFVVYERVR